jgi:hypothetical protein
VAAAEADGQAHHPQHARKNATNHDGIPSVNEPHRLKCAVLL